MRLSFLCIALLFLVLLLGGKTSKVALATDQITFEHSYDIGQGTSSLEQRIIDEKGTVYLLREISNPLPETGDTSAREFVATVQRPLSPEVGSQGTAAVRSAFAEALSLETDEYEGTLYLRSISQEPIYRSVEEQIERVVVYPDLVSEDVLQLPEREEFIVSSDEDLDASVTQVLNRLAVSWETTGYDSDGRPVLYEATVVFRGIERHLALDYFIATAVYSGLVPAVPQRETVLATYESLPTPLAAPVIGPLSTSEPATPLSTFSLLLPLVFAGTTAVIMLLALLFLLYFFLYRNARLVRVYPTGRRRVLLRKHLRVENGGVVFRVESSLALYREDVVHLITLNRWLASRSGHLTVLWGNRVVLCTALRREIDVTEGLFAALEDELEPLDGMDEDMQGMTAVLEKSA
jgi:hypothetical protein